MLKLTHYLICIVAASGLTQAAHAQEVASNMSSLDPSSLLTADSTRNERMEKDLNKRNSVTRNHQITWKDSDYGYSATYSSSNVFYMSLYDKDGKYVETLTEKGWKNSAPAKLKAYFDQSFYKTQKVIGFWEVTDPNKKGYYLELKDNMNTPTWVWVTEDGKFTTSPSNINLGMKPNKKVYQVQDSTSDKGN